MATTAVSLGEAQRMLDGGRVAEARSALGALIAARPNEPEPRYLLAVSDYRLGALDRADAEFRWVLSRNPADHRAPYGLGLVFEQRGQVASARTCYARALAVRPDFAPAAQRMAALDERARVASRPPPATAAVARRQPQSRPQAQASWEQAYSPSPSFRPEHARALVPRWSRLARFVFLTGLRLAVIVLVGGALAALIGYSSDPENEEAQNFAAVLAVASWVLGLLTYSIGRAWRVRLRGIARQVSSARGSGRSRRKTVVDLRVEPTDPRHRSFPLVPVELAGADIHGTVLPNDEIELRGVFRRGNYLSTRGIRVLGTGQLVRATGSKGWLVCLAIWLALTVALVLGIR